MAKSYTAFTELSDQISTGFGRIEGALALILRELRKVEQMDPVLVSAVAANTSVVESALTLIQGLAGKLQVAVNDPAAVQALIDQLNAEDAKLAAAVAANTPAAPVTPDVPQPVAA